MPAEYDEIGIWSEVKLAIIKDYASAYAKILDKTRREKVSNLRWHYIDAYAGPGVHMSRTTKTIVEGSPLIALNTSPPFSEYHFIDSDPARAAQLRQIAGPRDDVHIYDKDCNDILLRDVFPKTKYSDFRRALCLLDPYNINLKWEVIETAGQMGSIEVFLNFMIMDINRNALRRDRSTAIQSKVAQLTRLPTIKEIKYVASRSEFQEVPVSDTWIKKTYDEILYQISLRTLYELFQADDVNALVSIVFNGWVRSIDRATGSEVHACVMSLEARKDEFLAINLAHVEPKACFKKLKGVAASKLIELSPIKPLVLLNKEDKRFVDGYAVVDALDERTNLAAMDWLDFENLIREVFEKEFSRGGGEVKITQASRDGGVDAVAFDPDPIRGGKLVIQAKRYTNTVGVSAVRDLYGTVHNEGANKGILVTTSDFGPDAYAFAKDKPLTLISGGELLYLLQRHGHSAKIDLAEAKRMAAENAK